MSMVCDNCHVQLIRAKLAKPYNEVHGPNGTRWQKAECYICEKETDCVASVVSQDLLQAMRHSCRLQIAFKGVSP